MSAPLAGKRYVFTFKDKGAKPADVVARSGQQCVVVGLPNRDNLNEDFWAVKFDDGFMTVAWEDELREVPGAP